MVSKVSRLMVARTRNGGSIRDKRLFSSPNRPDPISIFKPGKDPALPSSYRPISLLDTIGKLFEKILLARILHVVTERGMMRDE